MYLVIQDDFKNLVQESDFIIIIISIIIIWKHQHMA
jgi:hypothetical protein